MKSIVHKVHAPTHYSVLYLSCVEDPKLSALAKALHTYAVTRPPDWDLNYTDICNHFRESKSTILRAMSELEAAGYLTREQTRDESNRFSSAIVNWYYSSKSPCTEKPCTEKPCTVDDTLTKNQCTSNLRNHTSKRKSASSKKRAYADHVTLTEAEHGKLVADYGEATIADYIRRLDDYKFASGRKYASDYLTILNWIRRDAKPEVAECEGSGHTYKTPEELRAEGVLV